MSAQPFRQVLLDAEHDRKRFDSGSTQLDRYFREQVSQDIRRRVAACFVAVTDEQRVAGYYTLASASVERATARSDCEETSTLPFSARGAHGPPCRGPRLQGHGSWRRPARGRAASLRPGRNRCARPDRRCEGRNGRRLLSPSRIHCLAVVGIRLFLPLATVAGISIAARPADPAASRTRPQA